MTPVHTIATTAILNEAEDLLFPKIAKQQLAPRSARDDTRDLYFMIEHLWFASAV